MTFKNLIRLNSRKLKAHYPRIRIWKIDSLKMGYVSIPKSASSSIRRYLTTEQQRLEGSSSTARISLSPAQVSKLREEIYLFSFVRNPLTRLYSCYRDKLQVAQKKRPACTLEPYGIHYGMSFEKFARRVVEIPHRYADQHFRSISTFLVRNGELNIDYVGKFEQLDEDWKTISEKFDLKPPERTRRVSGPSIPIEEIPLSKEALALVISHYQTDLDTFGYREELEKLLAS